MSLSIWKRIIRAKFGVALALCIMIQGVLMAVVNPLLPIVLSNRIGMDKSEITLFFVINTLLGIVVALGSGYLSDGTIARYKLVLGGGLIASLGYLVIAGAVEPVQALIGGAITVAASVMFPQLFAVAKTGIMADWEPGAQIVGITALRTLFSLGYVFGTAIGSGLAGAMEMQSVIMLTGISLTALTLYSAFTLYGIERQIAQRAVQPPVAADTSAPPPPTRSIALPVSAIIIPILGLIVLRGADSTRGVYLSLVMFDMFRNTTAPLMFGVSAAGIGPLMFGITAAAELITMPLIGTLASRIGEKWAISLSALVGTFYYVILSFSQALPLLYAVHIVYAIFVAALLGVAMGYVQNMFANRVGMGGSLYVAVFNLGGLVGILSPLLVEGYSQLIFVIPAILCVVGAAMLVVGDRTAEVRRRLEAVGARS